MKRGPSATKDCLAWRTIHCPRETGAPKKRNNGRLKKSHTVCQVDPQCWSDMAADHDAWRHSTIKVVNNEFVEDRRFVQREEERKGRAETSTSPDVTLTCEHCSRHCLSRIGLVSHERACSRRGQTSKSSFAKPSHYICSFHVLFL